VVFSPAARLRGALLFFATIFLSALPDLLLSAPIAAAAADFARALTAGLPRDVVRPDLLADAAVVLVLDLVAEEVLLFAVMRSAIFLGEPLKDLSCTLRVVAH
jgi:hypothetical protein